MPKRDGHACALSVNYFIGISITAVISKLFETFYITSVFCVLHNIRHQCGF